MPTGREVNSQYDSEYCPMDSTPGNDGKYCPLSTCFGSPKTAARAVFDAIVLKAIINHSVAER